MFVQNQLQNIKAFFMDLDGVLTDGSVFTFQDEQVRKMNIKDSYALQWSVRQQYIIAVISGGFSESAKTRLESLGIEELHFKISDKSVTYKALKEKYRLSDEEILYIGDDLPDYPVMRMAGVAVAPSDASADILGIADYVTRAKGGEGAVREIIEQVMKLQGRWYDPGLTIW
jgi:3-deoxy-D-manno-octulosonate 8-phosphate phosphatase (KDO 8-P phosphatase)